MASITASTWSCLTPQLPLVSLFQLFVQYFGRSLFVTTVFADLLVRMSLSATAHELIFERHALFGERWKLSALSIVQRPHGGSGYGVFPARARTVNEVSGGMVASQATLIQAVGLGLPKLSEQPRTIIE